MLNKLLVLSKYKDRRIESLTAAELDELASLFGVQIKITDELKNAVLGLLKGQSLDTVSDMIQSPDSIAMLIDFVKRGIGIPSEDNVVNPEVEGMTINFA